MDRHKFNSNEHHTKIVSSKEVINILIYYVFGFIASHRPVCMSDTFISQNDFFSSIVLTQLLVDMNIKLFKNRRTSGMQQKFYTERVINLWNSHTTICHQLSVSHLCHRLDKRYVLLIFLVFSARSARPRSGASNKGGGKISSSLSLSVNISKTVADTAKVTIIND